jgi:hypothetical protein
MTKSTPPDPITEAEQAVRAEKEVLASLISKRADHSKRLAALSKERAEFSYDAHRGDPKARKKLDAIHLEVARTDSEFLSLDSAISTSQEKVRSAEAVLRAAVDADNTQRALLLTDGLRAQGAHLDETLAVMIEAYGELKRRIGELRSLGTSPVSEKIMVRSLAIALECALTGTDLSVDLHGPLERHSFHDLVDKWAGNVETAHRQHEEAA